MKTDTTQNNIPHGWRETNLGSIADLYQPQTISKTQMLSDGEYLVFGANGIIGKYDRFNHEDSEVIVTCRGASCGSISMTPKQAWITGNAMVIKVDENKVIKPYIYYFLNNSDLNSVISGGAQPQITRQPISAYKILFPESKTEQQKIAEILRMVDEDIAKTQEVIGATEKLKRGLMQQLFTRGIGHTKFKETELGEIPAEWEAVKLGDIGTNYIGLTYSPKNVTDDTGTLVLRSSNVQDGHISYGDNVYVDSKILEHLITRKGDILLCTRNGSRNLIGKCAFIDANSAGHSFGAFMSVYRTKYSDFIFQVFLSDIFKNQINKFLGATINQITNSSLNSFIVPLPPVGEQNEIVRILSSVDEKISVNKKLKEKLTLLKKGLMQDLLSGKVRTIIN